MKELNEYFDNDSVFTITKCEVIAEMVREREQLVYLIEADQEDKHGIGDIPPDYTEVDRMRDEILKKLNEVKNNAPVDFILEVLDMLGYGASIINNDNGMWGVVDTEICGVNANNELSDYNATVFLMGESFKETLREAVIDYLERVQLNEP